MGPLTAFSLVAGIIQVVDFSIRAADQCRQIYKTGATIETREAREEAETLRRICTEVKNTSARMAPTSTSQFDNDILSLAAKCTSTAEELSSKLDQLTAKSKWDIVPKFFRGIRKSGFIKETQQKLEGYQNTLNLSILIRLDTSSLKQSSELESLSGRIMWLVDALDNDRKTFHQISAGEYQSTRDYITEQHKSTRDHIASQIQSNRQEIAVEADVVKQMQNLRMLPVAYDAPFKSSHWQHESRCHPRTRIEIIKEIMAWSDDPSSDCILWLNGMAGTGKSTLARTIAQRFDESHRLAASFFFSRDKNDLSDAGMFITTLVHQIACNLPEAKPFISKAIDEDHNILHYGLREQWKNLIIKPLCQIQEPLYKSQSWMIVIDALDECQYEKDIRLILALLGELQSLEQVNLKVFLTSRPEQSIRAGFEVMQREIHLNIVALHDVAKNVIEEDIFLYLQHEFSRIRTQRDMPAGWPSHEEIMMISQTAKGLFIFASTACRFVTNSKFADRCLKLILEGKVTPKSPFGQLDTMYTQILRASVSTKEGDDDSAYFIELFRQVVGSIVNLQDPLPSCQLAELLHCQRREVHDLLQHFHSILNIPKDSSHPIRLLHPSFHDFLIDEKRCLDKSFYIGEESAHELLFDCCLQQMTNHLRRDMCKLQHPGFAADDVKKNRVDKCIPIHVQYACRFWVFHLGKSNDIGSKLGKIYSFFCKSFLHWLECLSLQRAMSESVMVVTQLELLIRPHLDPSDNSLEVIVRDAKRFALSFKPIIQQAPLQAYAAALVFAPDRSIIKQHYREETPSWVQVNTGKLEYWGSALQILEGHRGIVRSVAFSPDSRMIASTGWDAIRLWNPITGDTLNILDGHSAEIFSVLFSKDGRLLASTSRDNTIRLWDVDRGKTLQTLECSTHYTLLTSFSHDSRVIASFNNDDNTIRLWDVTTGKLMQTSDCPDEVFSVDFVPSGQLVISSPRDGKIEVWDVFTREALQLLEYQYEKDMTAVLSPDGEKVALTSRNSGKIKIFNLNTGTILTERKCPKAEWRTLTFSPDSRVLAWKPEEFAVEQWDIYKQEELPTLQGHSGAITSIAFSPDGRLLASGANDATIRLWSTVNEDYHITKRNQSEEIWWLDMSLDGQLLVSMSEDCTTQIWERSTGKILNVWQLDDISGHDCSLFSPDSRLLVIRGFCKPKHVFRLWNTVSKAFSELFYETSHLMESMQFSPDGRLFAVIFEDNQLVMWNTDSGAQMHRSDVESFRTLDEGTQRRLAFSLDSCVLASYYGAIIVLIDVSTGKILRQLSQEKISALKFSPDGSQIATGDFEGSIQIRDTMTGSLIREWEGSPTIASHWDISNSVQSINFSPDGQGIVAHSYKKPFILCDINTGSKSEFPIMMEHLSGAGKMIEVPSARFSPDGRYLVTNNGHLAIDRDQQNEQTQALHWTGLVLGEDWVQWNGKNLLWLPPDYRGHFGRVHDSTVIFLHYSRVVKLDFSMEDPVIFR